MQKVSPHAALQLLTFASDTEFVNVQSWVGNCLQLSSTCWREQLDSNKLHLCSNDLVGILWTFGTGTSNLSNVTSAMSSLISSGTNSLKTSNPATAVATNITFKHLLVGFLGRHKFHKFAINNGRTKYVFFNTCILT